MSLADAELHALAALAEAASFGGEFQQWTIVDGESTMDWRQTPSAESAYPNNVAFLRAASPDVVRELVARALKAEAIVRDLSACDPDGGDYLITCSLCKRGGYDGKPNIIAPMEVPFERHAESCPWRRAVEAGR